MPYLSTLIGRPITDLEGERIGTLQDLVASVQADKPHPEVVAVAVKRGGSTLMIPFCELAVLVAPAVPLTHRREELATYKPREQDLYLVRDVLDKQIIDTNDVRVVRVNDIELARVKDRYYVANVDISGLGLLRRLGLGRLAKRLHRRPASQKRVGISWHDVELLQGNRQIRLKVPSSKIADLHPADLAEIISDLSRSESGRLLDSLDVKTVADTLESVEPEFQASLIQSMPDQKAADVLEEMAPDEAADLLAELPDKRSEELLSLMEDEEAEDVRKLLAYPEDTAGGIMTTDFIAVSSDLTASKVISVLRASVDKAETINSVYVTDKEGRLVGTFSLRDLILAKSDTPVTRFMTQRVISVELQASQEKVAQVVAKYNLLAVPVVDEEGRLHGIVTADDALDKVIPTAWKQRLPRLYH